MVNNVSNYPAMNKIIDNAGKSVFSLANLSNQLIIPAEIVNQLMQIPSFRPGSLQKGVSCQVNQNLSSINSQLKQAGPLTNPEKMLLGPCKKLNEMKLETIPDKTHLWKGPLINIGRNHTQLPITLVEHLQELSTIHEVIDVLVEELILRKHQLQLKSGKIQRSTIKMIYYVHTNPSNTIYSLRQQQSIGCK